jgi:Guanylate-binding protein, C-terminal domain
MSDEAKLAHLESVPQAQLRPEFREGLAKLVDTCFARAQPKRVGGNVLTGPLLAGLVVAYVDAINKGAVPTIATAWQGVAESECRRAADEAERAYREGFRGDVPAEPGALQAEHQRALGVAKALFDRVRARVCACCVLACHGRMPAAQLPAPRRQVQ